MKKFCVLFVALILTASCAVGMASAFAAAGSAPVFSTKTYIPEKGDFIDYWGGVGDIEPADGDGITTFAHAAMTVPLAGEAIEMKTSFMLYSKRTPEEGGDGVDAWCTYSFSAQPGADADNTFPSYTGRVNGYFLHITNYSSLNAPNCVEVQVVECLNGGETKNLQTFFLDGAVTKVGTDNVVFTLSLSKVDDYDYTLSFRRESDGVMLKEVEHLELDDELFINENGQTFFGTALYEQNGACDGEHWNHRGVNVYSVQAYTYDTASAVVSLEQDRYVFEEGKTYKPAVTVTVGGVTLEEGTDYYLQYADNKAVGTGRVSVNFINSFAGNPSVIKEFAIEAFSSEPGSSDGCGSFMGGGSAFLVAAFLAGACLLRKREAHRRGGRL